MLALEVKIGKRAFLLTSGDGDVRSIGASSLDVALGVAIPTEGERVRSIDVVSEGCGRPNGGVEARARSS